MQFEIVQGFVILWVSFLPIFFESNQIAISQKRSVRENVLNGIFPMFGIENMNFSGRNRGRIADIAI
jgi:hypothetical protein